MIVIPAGAASGSSSARFLVLFVATGAGNGSIYRMIPVVFALRGAGDAATGRRRVVQAQGRGGASALDPAIGAFGGFLIPQAFNLSKLGTGTYTGAFLVFVLAYVALMATSRGRGLRPARAATDSGSDADDRHDRAGVRTTDTHCPYCALQCAMTLTRDGRGGPGGRPRWSCRTRVPDQPRRAVPEGLDVGRAAALAPDRLTTPLVRGADGRCCTTRGTTRSTLVADRLRRIRGEHGAGCRRGVRRRRPHQREGVPAGQVRPPGAAARRTSTTTAGSACPPRRPPATARSASTAGCRSR